MHKIDMVNILIYIYITYIYLRTKDLAIVSILMIWHSFEVRFESRFSIAHNLVYE